MKKKTNTKYSFNGFPKKTNKFDKVLKIWLIKNKTKHK